MIESVRLAFQGIMSNRLRSALTMLGILIGVAAVIILIAVGAGSSAAVQNQLAGLGTNTLTVFPSGGFGPPGGANRTGTQSRQAGSRRRTSPRSRTRPTRRTSSKSRPS